MAFTKTLILALFCLFSISNFVQETGARDVQLRNLGRSLAQTDGLESHSEISSADPNDDNEGDEGNEGNEGTIEGDEGGQPGGDPEGEGSVPGAGVGGDDGGDGGDMGGDDGGDGGDMGGDDGGDGGDMGGDDGGDGGDMGGDDGGDGGDGGDMGEDGGDGGDMGGDGGDGGDGADGGDDMGGDVEMPAEEMPAGDEATPDGAAETDGAEEATPGEEEEMPAEEEPAAGAEEATADGAEEETPAEEDPAEEAPAEEEEDDGTAAAAAGAAAAGAGAAAAGAAVAAGGDDDDEETAMAPTIVPGDAFAPGPAGTRDFDFGDVAEGPAQCTTLRDGLVNASPVLQSALPSIAPLGDTSTLATALDDPTLNVTVLLPDETILTQLGALLTSPDAAAVTPEQVQEILLDHILAMPLEAAELIELGSGMVDLITGEEIDLDVDGGVVMFTLNNITATVTEPDVEGCAGESVIHRIDAIFAELPAAGSVDEGTRELPGDVEEEGAAGSFASFAVPAVATALAAVFML